MPKGHLEISKEHSEISKDLHDEQENQPLKSCKNGSNRYHFGMTKQRGDEGKNGREYREHSDEDADLLYKKSKEHFGAWDIKDIVQDETLRSRKLERFEDSRAPLTNGRSKNDSKQDRYEDHGAALLRGDRGRTGSIDREQSHRKKKESWEEVDSKASMKSNRSRNEGKDDSQKVDERDLLLREIENLAVDGRSPDRRIRAMIERFKTREEDKLKNRKDRDSLSPEKEEYRSKSASRGDGRVDHAVEDRSRIQKDDREDERRSGRSKIRELEKECEETIRSRSVDRRPEKLDFDKHEEKRNDSLRQGNDTHSLEKSHQRRSREMEDDLPRRKDSPKRRSYAYENPEDFDVRIQRYERALLEPRRDLDSTRKIPLKDSEGDPTRKESFKDYDRQVSRKSSFKSDLKKGQLKERESSLNRKASFKNQESDLYRKNSFKNPDIEKKYFGKDPEHVSRKGSFKEYEIERKNSFKEQNSDYGRISSKNRENSEDRKNSFKGHAGVSRITFKDHDDERIHSYKDQDLEIDRMNSKDLGRKNSFKEKTVEFAGVSYKDEDSQDDGHVDRRSTYKNQDNEQSKVSYRNFDDSRKRHSPNGRYVEFGPVSYQAQADDPRASPPNDQDQDSERKVSKDRDSSRRSSPRNKSLEPFDKKSDRHSKPLTPPKRGETGYQDSKEEEFDGRTWHESNRLFAVKYLRENTRYRSNPEGRSEIERDPSPEMGLQELRDRKYSNEEFVSEMEDSREQRINDSKPEHAFGKTEQSSDSRYASTHERNGATIIRIRSSPETPTERRRRRRPAQDSGRRRRHGDAEDEDSEDEEDHRGSRSSRADFVPGRGVPTPSRRIWNYREGVWHFHESIAFDRSFMVQKREAIFINRWRR